MDGHETGLLNVPEFAMPEFLNDYIDDANHGREMFFIELRRDGVGSLVLDVDYNKTIPTRKQSKKFGAFLAKCVGRMFLSPMRVEEDFNANNMAVISMCPEGAKMHIAIPMARLTQQDALKVLCTLPRLAFEERQSLPGFAETSYEQFQTIIDIAVVMFNGVRMNGSRKCQKRSIDGIMSALGVDRVYSRESFVQLDTGKLFNFVPMSPALERIAFMRTLINCPNIRPATLNLTLEMQAKMDVARFNKSMAALASADTRLVTDSGDVNKMLGPDGADALNEGLRCLGYDRAPRVISAEVMKAPVGRADHVLKVEFDRKDPLSRWCINARKVHKSNTTFCLLDFHSMELTQLCRCNCLDTGLRISCHEFVSAPVLLKNIDPACLPCRDRARSRYQFESQTKPAPAFPREPVNPTLTATEAERPNVPRKKSKGTNNLLLARTSELEQVVVGGSGSCVDKERAPKSTTKSGAVVNRSEPDKATVAFRNKQLEYCAAMRSKRARLEYSCVHPSLADSSGVCAIMTDGSKGSISAQGMCAQQRSKLKREGHDETRMHVQLDIKPTMVQIQLVIPPEHPDFGRRGGRLLVSSLPRVILDAKTGLPALPARRYDDPMAAEGGIENPHELQEGEVALS